MKAELESFLKSIQELGRKELISLLVRMKEEEITQSAVLTEMRKTSTAMTKDFGKLQEQLVRIREENDNLKKSVAKLSEQNAKLNQKVFGRQSEKMDHLDDDPVTEDPLAEDAEESEPDFPTKEDNERETESRHIHSGHRKKRPRRGINVSGLPSDHRYLIDIDQLNEIYGPGWEIVNWHTSRKVERIEELYYVEYTHVPVIKGADGTLASIPFDSVLRKYSLATSSLVASIMYKKISLGLPLYRIETDLGAKGFPLTRKTMSNWMVYFSLTLFGPVYDYMWEQLLQCPYTQHDETTVQVLHDGRSAGRKSYMWAHMTSELWEGQPIIVFSYEKTRKADHLREFFPDYSGTMTSDAYSGYSTFAAEHPETITLSGCLMHARRPLANSMKLAGSGRMTEEKKAALPEYPLLQILGKIFALETEFKDLSAAERKEQRDQHVSPLLKEYFQIIHELDPESPEYREEMKKGIWYSRNHEAELSRFLEDGHIPCDNGAAERHIRSFACGRKAWLFCNTVEGAKTLAILFTLVETAKANQANVYYYLKYLLDSMPAHMNGTDRSFLPDMMPWSEEFRKYEEREKQSVIERFRLNPCADPPRIPGNHCGPPEFAAS